MFCENCGKPVYDDYMTTEEVKPEVSTALKEEEFKKAEKKPVTKKRWFWLIAAIAVISIFLILLGGKKDAKATEIIPQGTAEAAIVETETTTEATAEAPAEVSKAKKVSSKHTFSYADFVFKIPGYFNKSSYIEGFDYSFYPEEKNYYASIGFLKFEADCSKEEFETECMKLGDSVMGLLPVDKTELVRSTIVVDGTKSYLSTFRADESEMALALLFDDISNEFVIAICSVDDKDESEYDYIADFKEMLENNTKITRLSSKKVDDLKERNKKDSAPEGIRPEIKEALDSYEEFFDEYIAFMEKHTSSSNPLGMMSDYLDYMNKYTETMEKLEKIESEDMSVEEEKYYHDVLNRINKKLLDVSY